MTFAARSTAWCCWPGHLLGLTVLAVLPTGCGSVRPPAADAALSSRIQAPPGVGGLPPPRADLPPPRATPGDPESPTDPGKSPSVGEPPPAPATPRTHDPDPAASSGAAHALSLDDAIALAFQYQPRLRVLQEQVEQARARGDAAFAAYLPTVTFYNREFTGQNPIGLPGEFAPPMPEFAVVSGSQSFYSTELYLRWTIWDFGRRNGRYRQAEIGIDIAELQALRNSQTVVFEVGTAYFRLLQAQATLRTAQEAVRLAESVLDVTRKSQLQGLVLKDAVLRAEVQVAQARRAVVAAERARLVAVATLNRTIGINVSAPTEIVDRTDEPPFRLTLAESLQVAIDNRREFQVARRAIEQAAEGERVARAEFAPRVYVEGMGAASGGHKTLDGTSSSATIVAAWDLYQGGKRRADLREASSATRATVDQAQVVCDAIAWEVNEAYWAAEAARQSIDLARPAVTQARENLRLVTLRYEKGTATPTDIVDAENSLIRAIQDLYTSQYEYLSALIRMDYATGTTPFLTANGSPRRHHP